MRKELVLRVFLNIKGTFYNSSWDVICKALNSFKIEESIERWIHNMLRTRTVMANCEGTTIEPTGAVRRRSTFHITVDTGGG